MANTIPTNKIFTCPSCKKHRMVRPVDHVISIRKVWSPDNSELRFVDVCDACLKKYYIKDLEYKKTKVNKAKEAINKKEPMPDGVSLEDGLIE